MTTLHSGSTKRYSEGWELAFGKSRGKKGAAKKPAAAKPKASAKRKPTPTPKKAKGRK